MYTVTLDQNTFSTFVLGNQHEHQQSFCKLLKVAKKCSLSKEEVFPLKVNRYGGEETFQICEQSLNL